MGGLNICALGLRNTISAGGGGASFSPNTTVVSNTAELIDALENDRGDTYILPGSYDIDTDSVGPLDTTPREFIGAAISDQVPPFVAGNGVNIRFTGAGGSITSLDFSASLTESTGVQWRNVNFVSDTASLLSFLTGVHRATNIHMNAQTLTSVGIGDSLNISDCVYINPPAGGIGFFGSSRLVNCTVGSETAGEGAESGFFICEDLTNCRVIYEAGATGAFNTGFTFCNRLTNCSVNQGATTAAVSYIAFSGCTQLTNCTALGPTAGALAGTTAFNSCLSMKGCDALRYGANFNTCERMTDCTSTQGTTSGTDGTHYTSCVTMKSCVVDGTGDDAGIDGFDSCIGLTACRALSCTGNGFVDCSDLSSCRAISCTSAGFLRGAQMSACFANLNGSHGFFDCSVMAACDATANTGDGFNVCALMSSCNSVANTGFGYASNSNMSSCSGVANVAGATDALNTVTDPVTTLGP